MRQGVIAALVACTVIFGPERFPLDGVTHTELRISLCTQYGWTGEESAVLVETRTYERTQNKDLSYTTTMLSTGEDGWTEASRTLLDIVVREPKP